MKYGVWEPESMGLTRQDKHAMAYLISKPRPQSNPDFFAPLENPKTLRHRESTMVPMDILQQNWNIVECARIVVPYRQVGHLTVINQFLSDKISKYYATSSEYWGVPYHGIPEVDDVRWYFRTESYNGLQPNRYLISSGVPVDPLILLPGFAWSELPQVTGLWYPPKAGGSNTDLTIDEGTMLRMFVYSPPTVTYSWTVAGRMAADIQSSLCREATSRSRLHN
jgi:hypothetical protein